MYINPAWFAPVWVILTWLVLSEPRGVNCTWSLQRGRMRQHAPFAHFARASPAIRLRPSLVVPLPGFWAYLGKFRFSAPLPHPHRGRKAALRGLVPNYQYLWLAGRLGTLPPPSIQNPAWFTPAVVILTRLALGAPRSGGLCGAGRGRASLAHWPRMRSGEYPAGS